MPRGLKVLGLLIANVIPFVNIKVASGEKISISWYMEGHIGIRQMPILRFQMWGEDIFEGTNGKCHAFTFLVCKEEDICVHFGQLVDHCDT